jgi:hypothetical protein
MPVLNTADGLYVGSSAVDAAYMGAAQVWPPAGGGGGPGGVAGLHIWYDAEAEGLANNTVVTALVDQSGNARNASVDSGQTGPTIKTGIVNGLAVYRWNGTTDRMLMPDLSALASATGFVVVKVDTDPPADVAQSGLWYIGSSTDSTHFPYLDGTVYDQFGTNTRKTTVNPTPSLSAAFRIYEAKSASGAWASRLDGASLFSTATNTPGFASAPVLGANYASIFHDGDIAAFLLYTPALSDADASLVRAALGTTYGITVT